MHYWSNLFNFLTIDYVLITHRDAFSKLYFVIDYPTHPAINLVKIIEFQDIPSNPWLSWISRGGPVVSCPSRTAKRHWWIQIYCCSVCTIQTRSFLITQTIPKISTYFDTRICCSILSKVMKVPLRPTPALQWTTMGLWSGLTRSLNARTNLAKVCGGLGTPKSGQVVKWKCCITLFTSPYDILFFISIRRFWKLSHQEMLW